jgi:hypothetical protein
MWVDKAMEEKIQCHAPHETSEQNRVFPPFSGELREDGKVKLSHMNLKQTIVDIFNGKV